MGVTAAGVEAAGCGAPPVRERREMDAGAPLTFIFSPRTLAHKMEPLTFRKGLPSSTSLT